MPNSTRVDCLQCSAKLKIDPAVPANGVVMCPACGQLLNLAAPGRPGAVAQQPVPPIRPPTPQKSPMPMPNPAASVPSAMEEWDPETSRPKSRRWLWVMLASVVVAAAAGAVGYYLRLKGGW